MRPFLLTVEYLPAHDLYMVIPTLSSGRECQDTEWIFCDESSAHKFIIDYFDNPTFAVLEYNLKEWGQLIVA